MPTAGDRAKAATIGEMATRANYEVMQAGRETVQRSATRWRRVTDGNPCGFCAMVASRGPVYRSQASAEGYHARCGCTAEPFDGDPADWEPTPDEARFIDAYREAYQTGIKPGDLADGIEALLAESAPVGEAAEFMGVRAAGLGFDEVTQDAIEHVTHLMASVQNGALRRDISFSPLPAAEAARNKGLQGYFEAGSRRIVVRNADEGAAGVLNTIAHEMGHAMERSFGMRNSAAVNANRSTAPAAWREWNKVIRRTARFKELAAIKSPGGKYLRQNNEMWARSYAQWVAVRTGDRRMLDELAEMREGEFGVRIQVWDDDDFEPVAAAIDEIVKDFAP